MFLAHRSVSPSDGTESRTPEAARAGARSWNQAFRKRVHDVPHVETELVGFILGSILFEPVVEVSMFHRHHTYVTALHLRPLFRIEPGRRCRNPCSVSRRCRIA